MNSSIPQFKQTLLRMAAVVLFVLAAGRSALLAQQMSVVDSPHNLSASGPGAIRAVSEDQVCIFCHAPHHASTIRPLWNRAASTASYTPYQSNSLQATPGQPTGSSKFCLSCHDGTIALGSVISRQQQITMANGVVRMPAGASNVGTDLSDDHPISFPYDLTLLQKNPKLRNPSGLPGAVKLDSNSELQCVSCHEPHNNQFGKFLVMANTASQLCNTCHNQGTTTVTAHGTCSSCHQSHTAPSGPYLLKGATVTATCTASTCHGTQASQPRLNIAADVAKISNHDTNSPVNQTNHVPDNTVCTDCHEPHTMGNTNAAGAPAISPRLGQIDGINALGSKVAPAQYEYQVCFKCHGDQATTKVTVKTRKITQPNKRLQFASGAVSFHPVEIAGKSTDVPSLRAPWTTSSIMYCTDCHASNSSPAGGGTGAKGPHGSVNSGVLVANYTTTDGTTETPIAYALCYLCHDRTSILNNTSFSAHSRHIGNAKTPCSVCHDSHGIAAGQGTALNNSRLINFDTSVALPDRNGRLEYQRTGNRTGLCYLKCHNRTHSPATYP